MAPNSYLGEAEIEEGILLRIYIRYLHQMAFENKHLHQMALENTNLHRMVFVNTNLHQMAFKNTYLHQMACGESKGKDDWRSYDGDENMEAVDNQPG